MRPRIDIAPRAPASTTVGDVMAIVARLAVGGVLFYAGFVKAVAPLAEFAAAIQAYHVFPSSFSTPIAFAVPWLEMAIGTYLLFGFETRRTAIVSTVLFTAFLILLASAIARGIDLSSCGCFGADALNPRQTIWMDAILLVLSASLVILAKQDRPFSLDRWLRRF